MDNSTSAPFNTPDVGLILQTQFRVYDGLISATYWICLLIGLPGNCLSLTYFIKTGKRNLSTWLYIIMCVIDIFCCTIQIPVAISLLNERSPGLLLGNMYVCSAWHFVTLLLQQMAMYVTMLLALTRSIVIMFPFFVINRNWTVVSVAGNLIYHIIWNVMYYSDATSYYSTATALCTVYSHNLLSLLYNINYNIFSLAPPVIIFISIAATTYKLRSQSISRTSRQRCRYSSMTIIYFSVTFLVSNSFAFVNNSLYIFTLNNPPYPGPIYESTFMFFYSWQFSFLFCTVLNSALNPLLYFWRMSKIRSWVLGLCMKNSEEGEKDILSIANTHAVVTIM